MNITCVPGFNPGPYTGAGNRTYLVRDASGEAATLVDAATGEPRHGEALRAALGRGTLDRVVVTHAHADHVSGVHAIVAAWPAAARQKIPWPARDAEYPVGWRWLADGDTVPVGRRPLRVLHTPGHAPDHLCLFDETDGVLFSGDLLIQGQTVVVPGGHGGDLADYLASLARIRALKPACALPAHGPTIEDVTALVDRYVEHRHRRDDDILRALHAGPVTREDLVARVYAGLDPALTAAAAGTVLAHLVKLEGEGRVRRTSGDPDPAWEAS